MRSCPASHTTNPLTAFSFALHPASHYSCLPSSFPWVSHTFFASLFLWVRFFPFSFHHNVSLFSFLCPEGTPNTFSVSSALQLYFPSLSTQSLSRLWSFFSFHYLILVSAFIRFLLLINNFILGTTIQCCLATLSPWHHLSALSDCTFCIKSLPPLAPYLA